MTQPRRQAVAGDWTGYGPFGPFGHFTSAQHYTQPGHGGASSIHCMMITKGNGDYYRIDKRTVLFLFCSYLSMIISPCVTDSLGRMRPLSGGANTNCWASKSRPFKFYPTTPNYPREGIIGVIRWKWPGLGVRNDREKWMSCLTFGSQHNWIVSAAWPDTTIKCFVSNDKIWKLCSLLFLKENG